MLIKAYREFDLCGDEFMQEENDCELLISENSDGTTRGVHKYRWPNTAHRHRRDGPLVVLVRVVDDQIGLIDERFVIKDTDLVASRPR